MTYKDTLDFLYSQLPMYSRIGKAAYKEDLNNTLLLCELLNHPEGKFKSIHVAGTNGKGSTCHMLAAILQTAGYKTGLYTSPHLKDFRERIRINGEMISEEEVTTFVEKYKNEVLKIGCSFFEWTVGLAFDHFAKHKVDIAVIETGMGGRLDSTNVITPLLSVITNISWDHAEILGNTLEKIATEKAGIIKPGVPVVIGRTDMKMLPVFVGKSNELKAPITFADAEWSFSHSMYKEPLSETAYVNRRREYLTINHDLQGEYQVFNTITVLASCDVLKDRGFHIEKEAISSALSQVKKITGLRGRWDIIHRDPLVIADVAHNEDGLTFTLSQFINLFTPEHQARFILGFVKEKDLEKILPLFPSFGLYYFCKPDIPRGLNAGILHEKAKEFKLVGASFNSVREAYDAALHDADPNDVIYVGGSTFVVAEVI